MKELLKVENLDISFTLYGKLLHAVRNLSFIVHEGESLGIVGESGCGKTTAMQAILRLSSRASISGKILFAGEDLLIKSEKQLRQIRGRKIGMIFQDPMSALNPTMKIGKQINEVLFWHGCYHPNRALELLEQVEMPNPKECLKQYPHQLSGGMRQRVLIAIALACDPILLIADEPTTALDVSLQGKILDLLKKRPASTSLILISHDLSIVANSCEKIAVLYAGEIVELGSTEEILHHPRHPYTQMLLRALPRIDRPKTGMLQNIEGSPPNPLSLAPGCAFRPRCPYAMPICHSPPPWVQSVRCWRLRDC